MIRNINRILAFDTIDEAFGFEGSTVRPLRYCNVMKLIMYSTLEVRDLPHSVKDAMSPVTALGPGFGDISWQNRMVKR